MAKLKDRPKASLTPVEPTVAEGLAYVDRIKADARQFAAKIKHKRREYKRTRLEAVVMIREATGAPYSEERLRKSGTRYLRSGRTCLYRDADLQTLAEGILDAALECGHDDGKSAPNG